MCDVEHYFCTCLRVLKVWKILKLMILDLLSADPLVLSDWQIIYLHLPRSLNKNEVIWLLGIYVTEVLKLDQFFGFLKYKYRKDQLGARLPLNLIPGLS